MSTPLNQFRQDYPWTCFVLLDLSAEPVPSQAKSNPVINIILEKRAMHTQKH